jgi:hypothetical protein
MVERWSIGAATWRGNHPDYVVRGNRAGLADLTQRFEIAALGLIIHEIGPFNEGQRALDLVLTRHVRGLHNHRIYKSCVARVP